MAVLIISGWDNSIILLLLLPWIFWNVCFISHALLSLILQFWCCASFWFDNNRMGEDISRSFFSHYLLDLGHMFMHSATDAAWIAASNHQQTLLSAHRNFSSKSPIQQGTGSLARFKSNAPLTMRASWEDIFCLLSYESSRYQFPLLAKDRSVVPLVRSSDPFFSEPELHYQPFNVTFKCERMQLSAVWFGRSVCAVISIGGLRPVASGSLAFCPQAGRCHSY